MNTGGGWGIFNGNTGKIDLMYASYEQVYRFFEENLSTENYIFNKEEMHAISPYT